MDVIDEVDEEVAQNCNRVAKALMAAYPEDTDVAEDFFGTLSFAVVMLPKLCRGVPEDKRHDVMQMVLEALSTLVKDLGNELGIKASTIILKNEGEPTN